MSSGAVRGAKTLHNRQLLLDFGQSIGLPDLRFDEDGLCVLSFDETVIFLRNEDSGALTIYAPLVEVPEEKKRLIQPLLLDANFLFRATRGASLCMSSHSLFAMILTCIKPSFLSLVSLSETVEEFVQLADFWREKLEAAIAEDKAGKDREAGDQPLFSKRGLKA